MSCHTFPDFLCSERNPCLCMALAKPLILPGPSPAALAYLFQLSNRMVELWDQKRLLYRPTGQPAAIPNISAEPPCLQFDQSLPTVRAVARTAIRPKLLVPSDEPERQRMGRVE